MARPKYGALRRAVRKALSEGEAERLSLATFRWNVAGACESPVTIERWARSMRSGKAPLTLILETRCRRCERCLAARKMLWYERAKLEVEMAPRTWFGTLTLRPEEHDRVTDMARSKAAAKSVDFDATGPGERFARRHAVISRYITLWLKRVRKLSGARFRYLLVAEAHKSGLPHYHVLLHETDPGEPVTKRQLQQCWPHGFTNFKLVGADDLDDRTKAAGYVCKYLAKSMHARVRASLHYGDIDHITESLKRALARIDDGTTLDHSEYLQRERLTPTPPHPGLSTVKGPEKKGC